MGTARPVKNNKKKKKSSGDSLQPAVQCNDEQAVLDVFVDAFTDNVLKEQSSSLMATIQRIKGDLYDRNYKEAFELSSPQDLACYAARWSPSRALAYRQLIKDLIPSCGLGKDLFDGESSSKKHVLCIGGGAGGEIVALSKLGAEEESSNCEIHIDAVDIADWRQKIDLINSKISTKQTKVFTEFHQLDILQPVEPGIIKQYNDYTLITIMFTTNELFAADKSKAINLIRAIASCKTNQKNNPPTYVLICESAGSFSDIQVGTKLFPLQFLIDYTFCGPTGKEGPFKTVSKSDSQWYRRPQGLRYPLQLEDMRYFYRLYKSLD